MYRYKYVTLEVKEHFFGSTVTIQQHREIIDKHAAKGWRYAGYIPTKFFYKDDLYTIDLIFEAEVPDE